MPVFHEVNGTKVEFHWARSRLFDQRSAQAHHDACLEDPVVARVEGCRSKPKSKWRPVPMDTVVCRLVLYCFVGDTGRGIWEGGRWQGSG